jgi:hypothetical protein
LFRLGLKYLAACQPDAYYQCVLLYNDKASLHSGLQAIAYQKMLKGSVDGEIVLTIEDVPGIVAIEDGDSIQEPVHFVEDGLAPYLPPSVDDLELPFHSFGAAVVLAVADSNASDGGGGGGADCADSSSSSTSSSSSDVDAHDAPLMLVHTHGMLKPCIDPTSITHVLGVLLVEESYIPTTIGTGAAYKRLGIQCPHSSSTHTAKTVCFKWRGLGERMTTRFGRLETIGFLGAWVAAAHRFPSKALHLKHKPSDAEVAQWLVDMHYIEFVGV